MIKYLVDSEARADINDIAKLATSYGVVPDAKYFNETDKKWYADATYTTPATDNTVALQAALDAAEGHKLIIPPACGVKGTVYIHSNTIVDGIGRGRIILLDGHTLDAHVWRTGENDFYPIIATDANSKNIKIKDFSVLGDKSSRFSGRIYGFVFYECENCEANNINVSYINYFPTQNTSTSSGMCIATMRAKNIIFNGGKYEFGGYECIRIGDKSENITLDKVYVGKGWRTGFQIIRGCNNIRFLNSSVIQGDLDGCDTEGAITLHSALDEPIKNVLIDNCYIEATTTTADGDGLSAISFVDIYNERIKINNTRIFANYNGITAKGDVEVSNCDVYAGNLGIHLSNINKIKIINTKIESVSSSIRSIKNIPLIELQNCMLKSTTEIGVETISDYAISIKDCEVDSYLACVKVTGNNVTTVKIVNGIGFKSETEHAIYLSCAASPQTIDKIDIRGNALTPASGKDGILISAIALRPFITNNLVTQGANGIRTLTNVDYAVVKDNDFSKTTNGVGSMTGTNNIVTDNFEPVV